LHRLAAAERKQLLGQRRGAFRRLTSGWAGIGWLALNLLVLFVGWLVIVSGAMRFAGRAL